MSQLKCLTCGALYDPTAGPCDICEALERIRNLKPNRHKQRDKIMQPNHQSEKGEYWYERED